MKQCIYHKIYTQGTGYCLLFSISETRYGHGGFAFIQYSPRSVYIPGSNDLQTVNDLMGEDELTITADLSGGHSWQHTQLFRQSLSDEDVYPFEVVVSFA